MLLLPPPGLLQAPPSPAPIETDAMVWVTALVTRQDGIPIRRQAYYVDLPALRRALRTRQHGKNLGAAALEALESGEIPYTLRSEYLTDLGGTYRRALVLSLLKLHWPKPAFDPERPAVRSFLDRVSLPRNQGDWVDEMEEPGRVRLRDLRSGSVVYEDPDLHLALCRINLRGLEPGLREQLKKALANLLSEKVAPGPPQEP